MPLAHFTVGGVPEHFNYPWYHAAEHDQSFADRRFSFEWRSFPGGTGAMCAALRSGEIDVAIMLTEGAVADISHGNPSRIIGTYVNSPLTWGIHVSAQSSFQNVMELREEKFAISRYQSGSHLMAYVNAQQQGWNPNELQFEVVGGMEGARKALKSDQAQVFMWEKFTTKPIVDQGEFRRVGNCVTPWPCFVLVAREEVIEKEQAGLLEMLYSIRRIMSQMEEAEKMDYISRRFEQERQDVVEWYRQTEWYCAPVIGRSTLREVQDTLKALSVIEQPLPAERLCAPFCNFSEQGLSGTMYSWRVESVYKSLEQNGKAEGPLQLSDLLELGHLDQYHYLGEAACYEVSKALSLDESSYVYDIGSGVGGTARVLADCSGCRVLGIELQSELCRLSTELTHRVGLEDKVEFKAGDFLRYEWEEVFDHFVSLLVFLHIPDRKLALQHCNRALKEQGTFVIEDFVALGAFGPEEEQVLQQMVSAPSVTTAEAYEKDLKAAGFTDLKLQPMTDSWKSWTRSRYEQFKEESYRHRSLFGDQLYGQRLQFYRAIANLFENGNLGGLRISGRKR